MLLGVGFKVILISTVVLGFLVPARAKLLARVGSRAVAGTGHFSRHPVIGLLQPFAQFLDSITRDSRTEEDKKRWATSAAPLLVLIAPLAAFAVIPFGSRYDFDGVLVSLVVADIEWGVVWLVGAAMLAIYGSSALIADPAHRLQHAILAISYAAGSALSLAALTMVFQTLSPLTMVVAQEQSQSIGDFFGPSLPALQSLRIPSWGLFLQPVSLGLFVLCALGTPSISNATSSPGFQDRVDGVGQFWLRTAEHLTHVLTASVLVALFLGAGAIPLVPADIIIEEVAEFFGNGFATLLTMAIHIGVFITKVMLVTLLLEPLRRRLAALSFAGSLRLCSWGLIPACVVNLWITGAMLVGGGS
jgi:NADH:ubiquinone oxidoreductase subunit H